MIVTINLGGYFDNFGMISNNTNCVLNTINDHKSVSSSQVKQQS